MKIHHLPKEYVQLAIENKIPRFVVEFENVGDNTARFLSEEERLSSPKRLKRWTDHHGGKSVAPIIDLPDNDMQKALEFRGHLDAKKEYNILFLENILNQWIVHTYFPNNFPDENNYTIIYNFENKKIICQKWIAKLNPQQANLPEWRRSKIREIGEIETFDMDVSSSIKDDELEPWQKTILGLDQNNWICLH